MTTTGKGRLIRSHKDLQGYQAAVESAMSIFEITRKFPREEVYSLTSQIRRSSRSVAANVAEAWRKRRYEAAFIAKLSDSDAEAAETQVHLEFAVKCGYLSRAEGARLYREYESLLRMLVAMINGSATWLLPSAKRKP
jgi:four helix bundle protein